MKQKIGWISIILVIISGCAHLDKTDKFLIGATWALTIADIYQTQRIMDDPDFYETNPTLGDDPRQARILLSLNAGGVTLHAISLPDKWRKAMLGFYIGSRFEAVYHNYNIGVR